MIVVLQSDQCSFCPYYSRRKSGRGRTQNRHRRIDVERGKGKSGWLGCACQSPSLQSRGKVLAVALIASRPTSSNEQHTNTIHSDLSSPRLPDPSPNTHGRTAYTVAIATHSKEQDSGTLFEQAETVKMNKQDRTQDRNAGREPYSSSGSGDDRTQALSDVSDICAKIAV